MGYPKLRASLRHLSRNSNSEVLAGRATVEVGGVWTVEEDVSQNTVRGGTREDPERVRLVDLTSEAHVLGNCNIKNIPDGQSPQ